MNNMYLVQHMLQQQQQQHQQQMLLQNLSTSLAQLAQQQQQQSQRHAREEPINRHDFDDYVSTLRQRIDAQSNSNPHIDFKTRIAPQACYDARDSVATVENLGLNLEMLQAAKALHLNGLFYADRLLVHKITDIHKKIYKDHKTEYSMMYVEYGTHQRLDG